MDNLEKFVKSHRAEFDTEEPSLNLWNHIEEGLPVSTTRRINYGRILWRAAAILIIFGAGWALSDMLGKRGPDNVPTTAELNSPEIKELIEAEAYYTSVIETRQAEVESYLKENPELVQELKDEFSNLDSAYTSLRQDLNENLSQQQIIEAMIQNYRIKVEILNELLTQLKSEHTSHETKYDF